MTATNTTTTTYNPIPTRVSSTHYQLPSRTRENKIHNIKLQKNKQGRLVWLCDCEDATYNKNPDCDHRVRLIEWIQEEKAKRQEPAEQKHSTSIELLSVLSRISTLEEEAQIFSRALQAQNELIDIKDQQIIILQDKMRAAEYQIKQQNQTVEDNQKNHYAMIRELSNLAEQQQKQIEKLAQELELQRAAFEHMYKDQAQKIDKLHETISSQQRPAEQIVRVVVEGAAVKTKTSAEQPTAKRGRKPKTEQNGESEIIEFASFLDVLKA